MKINRSYQIDSLQFQKQGLSTKLDYLKSLQQNESNAEKLRGKKKKVDIQDTIVQFVIDTINTINADSSNLFNKKPKKKTEKSNKKEKLDSLNKEVTVLTKKIEEIKKKIEELEKLNNNSSFTDNIASNEIPNNEEQNKFEKILLAIRKLEIGLTNPDFSEFLVSRTMVKGVNTEFQFKDYYLAFTYGTAVNIMLNSQISQPNVGEQFYNFLNVKNVNSGRKITAIKGGYGQKEESHIYGGLLYGLGKVNYNIPFSDDETNLVLELDGRLNFFK